MESENNPFSPGAGSQPPEFAGRDALLRKASIALARIKAGRSEKGVFMVGLRGVGKTVLLRKIKDLAEESGYKTLMVEVRESEQLSSLLWPYLREILFSLDSGAMVGNKVKRALRVLKSFVSRVKVRVNEIEFGVDIESERGVGDSGDLEIDLMQVFSALGEAAKERQTAIAIIIDELQYLNAEELSALIMAMHTMSQRSLPVMLIGAGLPQLVGKAGRAKSYAERLFEYPEIGPLEKADAKKALRVPVQAVGADFTDEALDRVVFLTKGYPYFLQEWGHHAWQTATQSPINEHDIDKATDAAITQLDQNFFRVRFDRLTPREKDYLRALAELGPLSQRSGEVAEKLGISVEKAAPIRNNLIKKGMIYSPNHGDTAFTVPLFDEFMKRIMPTWPSQ